MIKLRNILLIFIVFALNSCQKSQSILLENSEFTIKYIYKDQFTSNAKYSIERAVKITNKISNKNTKFNMEPDIEKLDEPRFFHVDSLELDNTLYQNLIWIEDPFALVIIELENMEILYNSHGEDNIHDRIEITSSKECVGKIRYRKLIKNDCTRTF